MTMTVEEMFDYWKQQAVREGESYASSWSDLYAIKMEIYEIGKRLKDGDHVIDIGCANGFSTMHYAAMKRLDIKGVDLIPEMIENANVRKEKLAGNIGSHVEFGVGDITCLEENNASYDVAIVTRVIINLGTRDAQAKALEECARILRPGGLLLLSEAMMEGWRRLNAFRAEWNLPPYPNLNLTIILITNSYFPPLAENSCWKKMLIFPAHTMYLRASSSRCYPRRSAAKLTLPSR